MIVPIFRHEVNAGTENLLGGQAGNVLSIQQHLSSKGFVPAEDGADQLRPSRTYHACNAEDFPGIQVKGAVGETVAAEVLHFQHRLQVTIVDGCAVLLFGAGFFRAIRKEPTNQHFLGEVLYGTFQGNHTVSHNGYLGGNFKDFRQPVGNVDDGNAFLLQVFYRLK